jgi:hypothetical protein
MTAADQDDADMGAAMTANAQAATQAANGVNAAGQNVTMPDGTNPETGEKTTTAAAPAGGQAASPAAPAKTLAKSDPNIKALQDKLIAAGAKIKADGVMGPATRTAMQQFPKAVSGNVPLPQGVAPSTAGAGRGTAPDPRRLDQPNQTANTQIRTGVNMNSNAGGGRGGQGGPTAAQMKAAPRPGVNQPALQAASPAAPVDPTKLSVSQRMATQPSVIDQGRAKLGIPAGGTKSEDRQYYEELDKMLTIAKLR